MKLIGITGGMGSGKSAVADLLQTRGWKISSSDEKARQLMRDDPALRAELAEEFGANAFTENGVNSEFLASVVFGPTPEHRTALSRLNQIVHPRVLEAHLASIERERDAGTAIMAIESALLYEVELEDGFDWVIVVDAPLEVCIERVMKRSGLTQDAILERIEEQMPMEEKKGMADFVIDNSSSMEDLEAAVSFVAMVIELFPDPDDQLVDTIDE